MLFEAAAGREIYLAILIVTFALHAALIGFVLGGAAWAAVRAARGGDDPVAAAARDWLPFGLGAAITAGIAPLLMIQVLYQHRMYTATLLLSHRFMAIVPVLIAGFYLLYLGKSERAASWGRGARTALHGATVAAFLFVAWTWIEEHRLASASPEVWVEHYRSGAMFHRDAAIAPRLLAWLGVAAMTFATGASWLARARLDDRDLRRLGITGLVGLAVAASGALLARSGPLPTATPWLVLGAASMSAAGAGFALLFAGRAAPGRALITAALPPMMIALAAVREAHRIHRIEDRPSLDGAQGLPLFLFYVVASFGTIWWLARLVRRHLRDAPQ